MTTEKRPRGRPVGSGKNDNPYLARVADALLADPKLKPSAAMKRVMRTRADQSELDETLLRRLQGKWRMSKTEHLEAAQKRLKDRQAGGMTLGQLVTTLRDPEVQEAVREAGRRVRMFVDNIANSPAARALAQFANSPAAKALAEYARSPAAKAVADYANSPAARAVAAYANSPAAKAVAEYANSPIAKQIAELHRSGALENIRRNIERIQNPAPLLPPRRF